MVLVALKDEPDAWLWLGQGWAGLKARLSQAPSAPGAVLPVVSWDGVLQPELPSWGQQKGRTGGLLPFRAHTLRDILTIGMTGQQRQPSPGGGGRAGFPAPLEEIWAQDKELGHLGFPVTGC